LVSKEEKRLSGLLSGFRPTDTKPMPLWSEDRCIAGSSWNGIRDGIRDGVRD
jgi:hypothetical protein